MVEWDGFENRCACKSTQGSNPCLSANKFILMPIDQNLNILLKEVWRIDNKIMKKEELTEKEKSFYNEHLPIIKDYYVENYIYWKEKNRLE